MCCLPYESERSALRPEVRTVKGIWEADELFRCPLIGLGLGLAEQKRLLKKMSFPVADLSPFEIHELFVHAAAAENPLSRKASLLLRRKYEREAAPLRPLGEEAFLARWKKALADGRYAPLLWAAATRELSEEARRAIYGDIHMAMHGAADEQMLTRREFAELERRAAQKAARLRCLKEKDTVLRAEKERMEESLRRLSVENESLRAERERLRAAPRSAASAYWERRGPELEDENAALRAALEAVSQRLEEREGLMRALLREQRGRFAPQGEAACSDCAHCETACCGRACDASCPSFDLCRKRVLIVGGVERMETLYRDFIERGGGELDYHNGSLQGGTRQLERSLRRADIILCPVNCNSHGACVKVKNLAKKHKKTFYMLPNGSLSTISRLLGGGQEGDTP